MDVLTQAALPQTRLQFRTAWRQHKNTYRIRHLLLYLALALYIDIQQHVITAVFCLLQHGLGRAVVVAKNQRVLQKFFALDHRLKFLVRNKVVFAPILFAASGRTGRKGNGELQVGNVLPQFIYQRGFAGA